MRIISQNGKIDLSYDRSKLAVIGNDKYGWDIDDTMSDLSIAKYSTEEKALKVMEMIRNASVDHCTVYSQIRDYVFESHIEGKVIFYMPQDSEVVL